MTADAAGIPVVDLARHACSRLTPAEQARFLGGTAYELFPELAP